VTGNSSPRDGEFVPTTSSKRSNINECPCLEKRKEENKKREKVIHNLTFTRLLAESLPKGQKNKNEKPKQKRKKFPLTGKN
jgi:hypothetical protein